MGRRGVEERRSTQKSVYTPEGSGTNNQTTNATSIASGNASLSYLHAFTPRCSVLYHVSYATHVRLAFFVFCLYLFACVFSVFVRSRGYTGHERPGIAYPRSRVGGEHVHGVRGQQHGDSAQGEAGGRGHRHADKRRGEANDGILSFFFICLVVEICPLVIDTLMW